MQNSSAKQLAHTHVADLLQSNFMTLVAGVDIGNSTTEIVISNGSLPVAWDRRPTRGNKGSLASVQAAHAQLRSIERTHSITADLVVVAPWQPVHSDTATVHEMPPNTGRLAILECASHSVTGDGFAVGVPWDIRSPAPSVDSIIAVVPLGVTFNEAAEILNHAFASDTAIRGIVVERDEAVLISARIDRAVPVVDHVDIAAALGAERLFIEVRPVGTTVTVATDVWALTSHLGVLDESESLSLISRWVRDERAVVIAVNETATPRSEISDVAQIHHVTEGWLNLFDVVDSISGVARFDALNIEQENTSVQDVWAVDISAVLSQRGLRQRSHTRTLALASLAATVSHTDVDLATIFGRPVTVASSEAQAAALGARTTPGAPDNALVIDIGGGTIDLIGATPSSVAGAGDMLTAAIAHVLDVPRGAADWIKRGPAMRVEAPTVVLTETGGKSFVGDDKHIPSTLMGSLIAEGPSGFLPFGKDLAPAEWRIMRQGLKANVIANNVARLLEGSGVCQPADIIVVGGPAADDELIPQVAQLGLVAGIGRGNVAGSLGHRYSVAFGLTQIGNPDSN